MAIEVRRLRDGLCATALAVALGTALLAAGCGRSAEPVPGELEVARDPVEARVGVDRAVATTGDLITYTVELDLDPAYEVQLPEPGAEIAGFRIVDLGTEESEKDGRRVQTRWYTLRADLVGSYVLPPIHVSYWRRGEAEGSGSEPPSPEAIETLATSEIFVEVESVLAADETAEDIRDLKPLREIEEPLPVVWIVVVAAVVLLAAGLAFWAWRRRREVPPPPPVPPHELAFAALDELRRTDFTDPEAVRRYYFRISEVLRAYVEGRFELNATDLTTEEILSRLGGLNGLLAGQRENLEAFLADTDRVKFAAYEPDQEEIGMTYERALGFVEATRPLPPPAAAEAPAEGAPQEGT